VLAANGKTLDQAVDFSMVVGMAQPRDRLDLTVWRRGKQLPLQVTMDDATESIAKKAADTVDTATSVQRLGIALRQQKPAEQRNSGSTTGLFIDKVSGAAERAGVQPGDLLLAINQEPVLSVDQARTATDRAGRSVALLVMRDGDRIFIPLRLAAVPTI
jgi:serine protease Do